MGLQAVTVDPSLLRLASEMCRADRQIVLAAVCGNGNMLRFASVDLRADRDVVLTAVRQVGLRALSHAENQLADELAAELFRVKTITSICSLDISGVLSGIMVNSSLLHVSKLPRLQRP